MFSERAKVSSKFLFETCNFLPKVPIYEPERRISISDLQFCLSAFYELHVYEIDNLGKIGNIGAMKDFGLLLHEHKTQLMFLTLEVDAVSYMYNISPFICIVSTFPSI